MYSCFICQSDKRQVVCCGKQTCEHSTHRFPRIESFWSHLDQKHPEYVKQQTEQVEQL